MRRSASISTPCSASVLTRITSSSDPSGSALWPVRCAVTCIPCARANSTIATTSRSSTGTAVRAGSWRTVRLKACVAASQPAPPGSSTAPFTLRRSASPAEAGAARRWLCAVYAIAWLTVPPRIGCSESPRERPSLESSQQASRGSASRTCSARAGGLRPQEGEHREHAAVVLRVRAEAELSEDRGDVLLDRALGDDQALCDRVVRQAFRHQLEHLPLARGQLFDRVVAPAAADQLRDDGGVERGTALADALDRLDERLDVGHSVLQQVADALRVLRQQLERVRRLEV